MTTASPSKPASYYVLLGVVALVLTLLYRSIEHADHAAPVTPNPSATWEAVVNPIDLEGGFIPAMWRASFPDGTTCYVVYGTLTDHLSCVRGTPNAEAPRE